MAALFSQRRLLAGLAAALGGSGAVYVFTPQLSAHSQKADAETVKKIEAAYAKLNSSEGKACKSLLKKHLTKDVVDKLKTRKTKLGATLYDCIRSGVHNLDAGIGVYAPDAESYKVFGDLFDKIIEDYHGFSPKQKQPPVDLGEGRAKVGRGKSRRQLSGLPSSRPQGQVHQVDAHPLRTLAGRLPVQPVSQGGGLPCHGGQAAEGLRGLYGQGAAGE